MFCEKIVDDLNFVPKRLLMLHSIRAVTLSRDLRPKQSKLTISIRLKILRSAIISSGAFNQFLVLFKFCYNGDASTRFLFLEFETFMSKNITL